MNVTYMCILSVQFWIIVMMMLCSLGTCVTYFLILHLISLNLCKIFLMVMFLNYLLVYIDQMCIRTYKEVIISIKNSNSCAILFVFSLQIFRQKYYQGLPTGKAQTILLISHLIAVWRVFLERCWVLVLIWWGLVG